MSDERINTARSAPEAGEVLSTLRADGSRRWMHPSYSPGRFVRWRRVVGWALIALFVALPIVEVGGEPAVWLDVARRRFVLFGEVFGPTDMGLLMIAGLGALLTIAWVTAIFGRVWCGWGCPQTVYLEFVFRPIERLFEGKAAARRRLDEARWDANKIARKGGKWASFALISLALAHVFVSYFVGWEALLRWMRGSPTEHWGYFVLMAATTSLVFFHFAYFREQLCTIACPYARLQSVLLDADSLIVSYDAVRGEPRGRRRRGAAAPALGDCVDCGACVRTCPTGIDIRDGLQLECVGCAQCIDACDAIMDRIGKPGGLIRYASERALEERSARSLRPLRPRVLIYSALIAALAAALAWGVSAHADLAAELTRAPGAPYVELPDGAIANRVRLRVRNASSEPAPYTIEGARPEGIEVRVAGVGQRVAEAGGTDRVEVWVSAPRAALLGGSARAELIVRRPPPAESIRVEFQMLGPFTSAPPRAANP